MIVARDTTVRARLYVFGGLPGVGKSTLARRLAQQVRAAYIRIDTIEEALLSIGPLVSGSEGYLAGYGIAADNLRLAVSVVADCVNPLTLTRSAWRQVALDAGAELVEIEVYCSDAAEHRSRIEARLASGHGRRVTWQHVVEREYENWDIPAVRIDTARRTSDESYAALAALLQT